MYHVAGLDMYQQLTMDATEDAASSQQQEERENIDPSRRVNQRVLDRLSLSEYKGPTGEGGDSESDAWVTDNEGMPPT